MCNYFLFFILFFLAVSSVSTAAAATDQSPPEGVSDEVLSTLRMLAQVQLSPSSSDATATNTTRKSAEGLYLLNNKLRQSAELHLHQQLLGKYMIIFLLLSSIHVFFSFNFCQKRVNVRRKKHRQQVAPLLLVFRRRRRRRQCRPPRHC